MKKALICLSIVAVLIVCAPNVTAASTSTPTIAIHSGHNTNARALQTTMLGAKFINDKGDQITTAKVNEDVTFGGILVSGTASAPNPIGGAKINIQKMQSGTWATVYTATTITGENKGIYAVTYTPHAAGTFSFRATYDGDSQYAPAVSNVAKITVVE